MEIFAMKYFGNNSFSRNNFGIFVIYALKRIDRCRRYYISRNVASYMNTFKIVLYFNPDIMYLQRIFDGYEVTIFYNLEFSNRCGGGGYNRGSSKVGTRPSSLAKVLLSYPNSGFLLISVFDSSFLAPSIKNMVRKNITEPKY